MMRTVREVARAVVLLQQELEELKQSWRNCTICADGEGCNAHKRDTNVVSDPVHVLT